MRKTILAAAAAFAVAAGASQTSAADLDFAPAPAPPPFVPTWAGFYIGGHVGYGETKFDFRQDLDFFDSTGAAVGSNTFRSSVSPDGLVGGIQGGYNWQVNSLVFGIEGDISFTDWGQGTTVFDSDVDGVSGLFGTDSAVGTASGDFDFLASVRGRVGYAFDSVLVYGTGGVAWADADARATIVVDDAGSETTATGKGDLDDIGAVAGAGLAWMVIPQTFSVGVEGLYYWFKDSTTLIDETALPYANGTMDVRATAELHDTWMVRARADFHF
ncbi:MAG: outer membrane protein [bacterium]